ncbi:hypothetical protein IGJ63_000609 [Enterococcus sp. DIV1375a]
MKQKTVTLIGLFFLAILIGVASPGSVNNFV